MRKHLLRILTVMLLVCLGAFGFAACGGNEEEETTYTLTYTANGGVGEDREEHYKEGETVTVKANPFTRDDYTFTTWKEEGTGTEHAPSSTFTMPAHAVTLAAQWEEDTPEPSDDIEGVWSVSSGDYVGFTVTVDVREDTAHVILLKNAADSNFVCMYLPFTKGQDGTYSLNGATLSLDGENLVYDTGLPGQSMTFTTKAPLPGALAITGVKYAVHQGVTVMHDVVEIDFGATPAIKHNGTAATGVKAIEAGGYKIFTGTVDTAPITVIAFRLDSHDYAAVLMGDSNKDRFDLVDTAPKFTVTYEQGEASGEAENMPGPVTETYEVGASYQLSEKKPTWEGHTFKGWKANAGEAEDVGSPVGGSASGPLYQPNGTYKFATPSNVTFVAQWEAGTTEQTYTVTFDVGTNGSSANAQQVTGKKAGESVPLPTVTANKGYTFTGWYKGSNKVAEPTAQSYSVSAADAEEGTIALTAHYDLISYTVKFDVETTAAGGSVSGAHADATITITDRTVTFPAGLSLGGYTLKGWKLGSGNLLTGASYEVTEAELPENSAKAEITFVAQWEKDTPVTYSVTYELGDHAGTTTVPTQEPVASGTQIDLPTVQAAKGYRFKNWRVKNGDVIPGPKYEVTGDVTIVAEWEAITYTVHFDINEPAGESGKAQGEHADLQFTLESADKTITLPTLTLTGYTLKGWKLNGDDFSASEFSIDLIPASGETITLVAQWEKDPEKFSVTYDLGAHAAQEAELPTQVPVASGTSIRLPAEDPAAATGYKFLGWKVNEEAELKQKGAEVQITAATTITAQWQLESEGVWTGKFNIGGDGDPVDATIYIKAAETGYKVKNEEQSETAVAFAVVSFEMQLGGPEAAKVAAAAFVTIKEDAVLLVVPMMEGNITLTVSEGNLVLTPQGVEGSPSPSTFTAGGAIPAEEKLTDGTLYGYDASGLYGMELTVAESGAKVTVKGDASAEEGDQDCQVYYIGSYAILLHDTSKAEAEAEYELDLVLVKDEGGYLCFVGDENYTIVSEAPVTLTLEKGEGTLLNGAERKYKKGTEITISELTSDVTPPDGYTFKEWQKDGVAYSEETLKLDAATTLTAVYEPKQPTVQFRGDGTGELSVTLTWNGDSKKWEGNLPAAIEPSDGTDFVDWKVDVNGSVSNKNASEKLELDPGDYTVTITANTKQPDQVTVTFQWADGDTTTESVDKNGSVTLPTDKQGRKPGYTLKGWRLSTAQDTDLLGGPDYTVGSDPVTLVAVWELMKPVITVEKGGSESEVATPEPVWQQESNNYKVTLPTETPELDGKRFDGWDVQVNGEAADAQEGYVIVTLSDNMTVTFTAKWVDVYGVTYNDGVEPDVIEVPTDSKKYAKDESVKIDETEPTREGYDFKGWKVNETEDIKQAGESVNMTEGGLTLTAQWDVHKNNVNYVLGDDASWDDELPTTVETAFGTSVTLPKAPKRTGYTFTGWKIEGGELNGTKQPNDTFTMPDAEVTVTAQWNKDDVLYTFNFYENKDDPKAKTTKTETLADGKTISDDTANTELTKKNYTFDGWFYEKDGTEHEFNNTFVPSDYGDTTIKVYAKWKLNDTITLDEVTAQGWWVKVYQYPENINVGETLTLTGDLTMMRASKAETYDGVHVALSKTNFSDHVTFCYDWRINREEKKYQETANGFLTCSVAGTWNTEAFPKIINGENVKLTAVVSYPISTQVQIVYTIKATVEEKEETFSITYVYYGISGDPVSVGLAGEQAKLTNGQIVRSKITAPQIDDTMDQQSVTIGTSTSSAYGTDVYKKDIKAGQTLTITGNLQAANTNLAGFGIEMVPYGVSNLIVDNGVFNFRVDNWANQSVDDKCERYNYSIAKAITREGSPNVEGEDDINGVKHWADFAAAKQNCDVTVTIAWTEADKIVITMSFTNSQTDGYTGYSATQVYTITPTSGHLADVYSLTISPDAGFISGAQAQITYSPIGG